MGVKDHEDFFFQVRHGECDFTKYNMFRHQPLCWSLKNIPTNQSDLRY